ncbi:MAG: NAD(P)-dependent oxidoreductase [Marinibacterium sp.]|nr:NAD(P)-dependent oxidoreductase [Marinibacterium sp.]
MKIGLIGCGRMGAAMAARLGKTGTAPLCWDMNAGARARVAEAGAPVASSPQAVVEASEMVILSLPNAAAVNEAMAAVGPALPPDAIVVDTTTSEPGVSRALAAVGAAAGWRFIDAPVSGGPTGARSGLMTMLVGGDEGALAKVRPDLDRLAAKIVHVGNSGAGHAAKIANNMLCAANLSLVAEAVRLAAAAGVAPDKLLEGINAGSGRSAVSEINFPRWILSGAFDSGFTMGLMRKDVALAAALAKDTQTPIPAFGPIADLWRGSADTLADEADFNEIARAEL